MPPPIDPNDDRAALRRIYPRVTTLAKLLQAASGLAAALANEPKTVTDSNHFVPIAVSTAQWAVQVGGYAAQLEKYRSDRIQHVVSSVGKAVEDFAKSAGGSLVNQVAGIFR